MLLRLIIIGFLSLVFVEIHGLEKEEPKGSFYDLEIATTLSLALEKFPVIRSKPNQPIATFTENAIPFVLTRKNGINSISLSPERNGKIKSGIIDMIKIKSGLINLEKNRFEIAIERKMYNYGADELTAVKKLIGTLDVPLENTVQHIGCNCNYYECEHYIILSILVKSPH